MQEMGAGAEYCELNSCEDTEVVGNTPVGEDGTTSGVHCTTTLMATIIMLAAFLGMN